VRQACQLAGQAGRELIVVASVTGTAGDPQSLDRQVAALRAAQVVVCGSNAAAARLAGMIVAKNYGKN
jgi:FdrA protein